MNTSVIGSSLLSPLQQTSTIQKTAVEADASLFTNKSATANSSHVGNDQANLSLTSTLLAEAMTTSDVRTEKVASLQQAIASGNYNIASTDVADKMIQSLLE